MLRQCLPASVRHVLAELPETLDETYERILSEIPKSNRVYAHRLLQCLTVAVRPLGVEELGEVLVVDFTAIGGIPKLKEDLRWEDQEQAVLSACSSLITVVENWGSRVVHFSHFSVKEFLTSDRLATTKMNTSRYHHIRLDEAHTTMAQACLSVILRLDEESIGKFPLARYAAQHFGEHVEFEDVLSHMRGGIDDLLDEDKPHFAAWLWMRDGRRLDMSPQPARAVPLYYVTTFGYLCMVDHLISKHPEHLNTMGEDGTLLHAASRGGHAKIVELLLGRCADVDVRNASDQTPLHLAAENGSVEVTRKLIERNADTNTVDINGRTPLYFAVVGGDRHGDGNLDVVRFLLDRGADADARDNEDSTPLHAASFAGSVKTVELLLEHGANIHGRNEKGWTPLLYAAVGITDAAADFYFDAILFLLEHGADADAQDNDHSTPLHIAAVFGCVKAARLLLEHGASVHLQNSEGKTAIQVGSERGHEEFVQLLSEHLQGERKI